MRELYSDLFEMNEYVYELELDQLKGLIVEATGAEAGSDVVNRTASTFSTLIKLADFEAEANEVSDTPRANITDQPSVSLPRTNAPSKTPKGINLSYTINLNLPATTDIEVFNAIFKSLKEHILES